MSWVFLMPVRTDFGDGIFRAWQEYRKGHRWELSPLISVYSAWIVGANICRLVGCLIISEQPQGEVNSVTVVAEMGEYSLRLVHEVADWMSGLQGERANIYRFQLWSGTGPIIRPLLCKWSAHGPSKWILLGTHKPLFLLLYHVRQSYFAARAFIQHVLWSHVGVCATFTSSTYLKVEEHSHSITPCKIHT